MDEPLLTLASLLSDESPRGAALRALLPALAIVGWFVAGAAVYAWRNRRHGAYRDADIEAKGETALLSLGLRRYFIWSIQPLWRAISRSGIPASGLTTLATLIGLGSGFAFAAGSLVLGGWLYLASGILDVFDGRLARAQGTAGRAGAVLDSVLDRYVDAAALAGLAWFYRDSWLLLPCLIGLSGSFLVSYVKARAEGVGVDVRVGLMQRPERVIALGLSAIAAPLLALFPVPDWGDDWLLAVALVWLALATQWTAGQRLLFALKALGWMQRPAWSVRKNGLARALSVAAVATLADFALFNVVLQLGWLAHASLATAVGCAFGAVVSFTLGRCWAFVHHGQAAPLQLRRYALVGLTSLALNAGGVALLTPLVSDSRVGWVVVRGLVFLLWNFPLHRSYVFQEHATLARAPAEPDVRVARSAAHWQTKPGATG